MHFGPNEIPMKNTSGIDDLLMATDAPYLLSALAEYHDEMESLLRDTGHARLTDVRLDTYEAAIEAEILASKYQQEFASLLRYSIVTSAYGICERGLHQLCLHAKERLGLRFDPCDMKSGAEMDKFKTFLDKSGVDVGNLDCWSFLADLTKLRNAIVHSGGGFLGEPEHTKHIKHIKSLIDKFPGLGTTEDYGITEINLARDLCSWVIKRVGETIEEVFGRIDNAK